MGLLVILNCSAQRRSLSQKHFAAWLCQADAPYFLSAKSKQKRYRQVRRPAQRAGCPAVLASDGVRRTRFAQTCCVPDCYHKRVCLSAPRRLPGSSTSKTNPKSKPYSAAKLSQQSKETRLWVPTAHEASHTSQCSQPKETQSPENLNEGTERVPLRSLRRHSSWRC